jgi:hypothetical protein
MQGITRDWSRRSLEISHECEHCGDIDDITVHAPLRNGAVVCWHCAERAGSSKLPRGGGGATQVSGSPEVTTAGVTAFGSPGSQGSLLP